MRLHTAFVVVALVVVAVLLAAPAAAGVFAQDHPDALDAPHGAGVTETPYGVAATECEQPTGSPRLVEGDLSVGPANVTGGPPAAPVAPDPDHGALDAPHGAGVTETPFGAAATACGQPTE
jgi:hypothetical protein